MKVLYLPPRWVEPHRLSRLKFTSEYGHSSASRACWLAHELSRHFEIRFATNTPQYLHDWNFKCVSWDCLADYNFAIACESEMHNLPCKKINIGSALCTGFEYVNTWFVHSKEPVIAETVKPKCDKVAYIPFGVFNWPEYKNPYKDDRKKVVFCGTILEYPFMENLNKLADELDEIGADIYASFLVAPDSGGKVGLTEGYRRRFINPKIKLISDYVERDYWNNGEGVVDYGKAAPYLQWADCGLAFASPLGYSNSKIDEYLGNGLPTILIENKYAPDAWRIKNDWRNEILGTVCKQKDLMNAIKTEFAEKRDKSVIKKLSYELWGIDKVADEVAGEVCRISAL